MIELCWGCASLGFRANAIPAGWSHGLVRFYGPDFYHLCASIAGEYVISG